MTSATSAPSRVSLRPSAFTLTEMLVAMGILVLLAGILLPLVIKSYSQAARTRTAAELQTIGAGLEAYKADFGMYPPVTFYDTNMNGVQDVGENPEWGAAVLAKALIGPGGVANDATAYAAGTEYLAGALVRDGGTPTDVFVAVMPSLGAATNDANSWRQFVAADGYDGPGFKVGRRNPGPDTDLLTTDDTVQGRNFGPYLQPDRFKLEGMAILDRQKLPILYFPALPKRPNLGTANMYVNQSTTSLYDANDNLIQFQQGGAAADGLRRVRAMMGDINNDGAIGAGETPVTTDSYLLWTAGSDLKFGPSSATPTQTDVSQCDDVTNFR